VNRVAVPIAETTHRVEGELSDRRKRMADRYMYLETVTF